MTPEHRQRWESEIRVQNGPLKKPVDLLRRAVSAEDFVDSAVLGGVSVADILAGKVAEWQIPSDVIEAFHAQYPHYGVSFVQAVNGLRVDPERLVGLVNGVKGKLFELDYVEWLNHGHLPTGMTATLAEHANNPSWDIAIRDGNGHIHDILQLKATESKAYVHEAIAAHPDIDVVVPHELYEKLVSSHDALAHILDGHEALSDLNGHMADAIGHAEAAGATEHFPLVGPVLVIGFATLLNYQSYRKGHITVAEALRNVGERTALYLLAAGAGKLVLLVGHSHLIALPVAVTARLVGGQFLHNRKRRTVLSQLVENVQDSRRHLESLPARPLLQVASDYV